MFNRRTFLTSVAATGLAAALPIAATASTGVAYQPGLVDKLLAEGHTVFIDFYASWCTTCNAQARVIDGLRKDDPSYDAAVTFVVVDWDKYAREALAERLNIPRRSTLVVLKGDRELGRIVAGTSRKDIKALLDLARAAATA